MTSILAMSLGAGGRTRTGMLLPAVDFESTTSTNSITPACDNGHYTTQYHFFQVPIFYHTFRLLFVF
jgi:hypothetical protein